MESQLLGMDKTDLADGNGGYLMSRPFDVERDRIPDSWEGQSRVKLLERMEKVALEYGMCSTFLFLFLFIFFREKARCFL